MENLKQLASKGIITSQSLISQKTSSNSDIPEASNEWLNAAKVAYYQKALEMVDNYQFDNYNKSVITNLLLYFGGFKSEYDNKKGIYLCGPYGSGKTIIMKIFRELLNGSNRAFRFTNSTDIVQHYIVNGNLDLFYQNRDGFLGRPIRLCIDELGAEVSTAKYFGTEINVMQEVLQNRYYVFQEGTLTHVTSNMAPSEIDTKYGDRVKDRMREMFNVVQLTVDKSRRK